MSSSVHKPQPCWNAPFQPLDDEYFIGREDSMKWLEDKLTFGMSSSVHKPQPCWNAPYQPLDDEYFIGRVDSMKWLGDKLTFGNGKMVAITSIGGSGKTALALMYAHKNKVKYPDGVMWIDGSTYNTLQIGYTSLALKHLCLRDPQGDINVNFDIELVLKYMKAHNNWLLVLDNVSTPEVIELLAQHGDTREMQRIEDDIEYIPKKPELKGHVIITSVVSHLSDLGILSKNMLHLPLFGSTEQESFLMAHHGILNADGATGDGFGSLSSKTENQALKYIARRSGGLPLLLEQMAMYMVANNMSYVQYWDTIKGDDIPIAKPCTDIKKSVSNTYENSFRFVNKESPATMAVLYFCAFCHTTEIPFEIFEKGYVVLKDVKNPLIEDFCKSITAGESMKKILGVSGKFNLVKTISGEYQLSIHGEIQRQLRDRMRKCSEKSPSRMDATTDHDVDKMGSNSFNSDSSIYNMFVDSLAKMLLCVMQQHDPVIVQKKYVPHMQTCSEHIVEALKNRKPHTPPQNPDLVIRCASLQIKLGEILSGISSIDEALKFFGFAHNTIRDSQRHGNNSEAFSNQLSLLEAIVHRENGKIYRQKGDVEAAKKNLEESEELHDTVCDLCTTDPKSGCLDKAYISMALSHVFMDSFDLPRADYHLRNALQTADLQEANEEVADSELNYAAFLGRYHDIRGKFHARRARQEDANVRRDLSLSIDHYHKALQHIPNSSHTHSFAPAWLAYAKVRANHKDRQILEDAKQTIEAVMKETRIVPGTNHRFWSRCQVKYAKVLLFLNQPDKALTEIRQALEKLRVIYHTGKHIHLGKAYFVKGEILIRLYERDKQPATLDQAEQIILQAQDNYPERDPVRKKVEEFHKNLLQLKSGSTSSATYWSALSEFINMFSPVKK